MWLDKNGHSLFRIHTIHAHLYLPNTNNVGTSRVPPNFLLYKYKCEFFHEHDLTCHSLLLNTAQTGAVDVMSHTTKYFHELKLSFCSIDEIIRHYKFEQIVQDLYLQHAVPQTADVSRECTNDIYQTIQREGQNGRAIFSQSNVVLRGYLFKKGNLSFSTGNFAHT